MAAFVGEATAATASASMMGSHASTAKAEPRQSQPPPPLIPTVNFTPSSHGEPVLFGQPSSDRKMIGWDHHNLRDGYCSRCRCAWSTPGCVLDTNLVLRSPSELSTLLVALQKSVADMIFILESEQKTRTKRSLRWHANDMLWALKYRVLATANVFHAVRDKTPVSSTNPKTQQPKQKTPVPAAPSIETLSTRLGQISQDLRQTRERFLCGTGFPDSESGRVASSVIDDLLQLSEVLSQWTTQLNTEICHSIQTGDDQFCVIL